MADDRLTVRPPQISKKRRAARHRWNCPSDQVLAAYLDGAVASADRGRIESHLAKCEYCRGIVADVVKLQRSDAPTVPASVVRSAIAFGAAKSRRLRWIFVPAAATAGGVLAVVVMLVLRSPDHPPLPSPAAPAPPLVAKSEPAPALKPPSGEVTRNSTSAGTLPQFLFPKQDRVVTRDLLKFEWKPVLRARYYEIRVVTPEGALVWEGQSETAVLKFPNDVTLNSGPYFAWISAYLDNGTVQRSAPIRFLVSASR